MLGKNLAICFKNNILEFVLTSYTLTIANQMFSIGILNLNACGQLLPEAFIFIPSSRLDLFLR